MRDTSVLTGFIVLGILYLVGTIFAMLKVDSLGRRYLMLRCLPFLALSMFLLSISMFMKLTFDYTKMSGWTCLVSAGMFVIFYSIGFSAQPWMVCSEIFPTHLRG